LSNEQRQGIGIEANGAIPKPHCERIIDDELLMLKVFEEAKGSASGKV